MALSALLLGPILFQDFEIPTEISWGGAQKLIIHRLPGGTRIIDAMGRDDTEITWSGMFSGPDAGLRARAVDLMRADGALWPLTWDSFFYSVVITRFEADYRRPNWIPYKIACTVLQDEAEAAVDTVLSLATSTATDLAAVDPASGLDLSAATAALALPGATTRGTASYSLAQSQLTAAAATADSSLAATGTQLIAATDPSQAAGLAGQAAQLAIARGYLQRAATNLANVSS